MSNDTTVSSDRATVRLNQVKQMVRSIMISALIAAACLIALLLYFTFNNWAADALDPTAEGMKRTLVVIVCIGELAGVIGTALQVLELWLAIRYDPR